MFLIYYGNNENDLPYQLDHFSDNDMYQCIEKTDETRYNLYNTKA